MPQRRGLFSGMAKFRPQMHGQQAQAQQSQRPLAYGGNPPQEMASNQFGMQSRNDLITNQLRQRLPAKAFDVPTGAGAPGFSGGQPPQSSQGIIQDPLDPRNPRPRQAGPFANAGAGLYRRF